MSESNRAVQARSKNTNIINRNVVVGRRKRLAEKERPEGTRATYDRAARGLHKWLAGQPATDAVLSDYVDGLFERGLSPAYAAVVVAAAADRAKRERAPDPTGDLTTCALAAFRRDGAGRGPGQVAGIGWEQADRMAGLAEACRNAAGLRDALYVRIASNCLLRVGEASALDVADISIQEDGLRVVIRSSKTDQEGKGSTHFAGPAAARLAHLWLATTGIEEGPLLRPVNKAGAVAARRLGERSLRNIVKRRAVDAGFEGCVSGHSFRVGAAQSLRDAGATTPELMAAGRWKRIETMAHYIREQDAAAGPVARLRHGIVPPDGRTAPPVRHEPAKGLRRTERKAAKAAKESKRTRKESRRLRKAVEKVEKRLARIEKLMYVP